jgi:hypothetical protein
MVNLNCSPVCRACSGVGEFRERSAVRACAWVALEKLKVMSGEYVPARFREWPVFLGNPNPYSSGALTRSPSAVVANPGSITISRIVFPDWAMINCPLMGGRSPFETVKVPVQSGFTE